VDDEALCDPVVVALDPGTTTGWCVLQVHPDSITDAECSILDNVLHRAQGQIAGPLHECKNEIIELVDAWPTAAIVTEDFILRIRDAKRETLDPVRINEVLEWALLNDGRRLWYQQPADAKKVVDNDRLKRWGFYDPDGNEHQRDATRHALLFLRKCKERPALARAAWPWLFPAQEATS
jgi:hypothetical protein